MYLTDSILIKADKLSKLLNISKSTIWRWRTQGILPQPIYLGPRVVVWETSAISDWLDSQKIN